MEIRSKKASQSKFNSEEFIKDQFSIWLKDTTHLDEMADMGCTFFEPCIIVELFVVHIQRSKKVSYGGFDTLYTPYARVLQVAGMCADTYKELKPGDIVSVNDHMTTQEPNPDYDYHKKNEGRQDYMPPPEEPQPYRRRIWQWIVNGYFFHTDKMKYITQPKFIEVSINSVASFKGPYVFKLAQHEIIYKPSKVFGIKV